MNFKKTWKRFFTVSRASEGFTLVELIVVIAILAILAGTAVPAYSGYIKKANKAADLQLLGAVNTAFAAAALENGDDVTVDVSSAALNFTTSEAGMKVTGVASVNGAASAAYHDAFVRYYGENSDSLFKTVQILRYNALTGAFEAQELSEAYQNAYNRIVEQMGEQIEAVQGSAFAEMGASALLGQVAGVTDFAMQSLFVEGSTLYDLVFDEDRTYATNLAGILQMDVDEMDAMLSDMPDGGAQFLANSTVLTVAQTVNDSTQMSKEGIQDLLKSGNFGSIVTAIQTGEGATGLANAALLYGMYTAYDPAGAASITSSGSLSGLSGNSGFMTYLSGLGTDGSDAQNDLDGYLAALDIVNQTVGNDPQTAVQTLTNGYTDPELAAIIQQMIG